MRGKLPGGGYSPLDRPDADSVESCTPLFPQNMNEDRLHKLAAECFKVWSVPEFARSLLRVSKALLSNLRAR
jgi:hypothetical protein